MADMKDLDGISAVVEADTVIADPEAKLRRLDSLQSFHVALFGGDKAGQTMQKIEGSLAVDGANVGFGLIGPGDLFRHFFLAAVLTG